RRGAEVAGKEEFRGRLGVTGERQSQTCIDDVACLSRAAVSLGVRRIVTGHVSARGKQWVFSLALNNVESGQVEARGFRLDVGVELGAANLPARRRWPRAVVWTSAGLAGLSAAAGGFLGVLSQQPTSGATRADIQSDYDQRSHLARAANVAWISAGVLAAVSL